MLIRRTFIALRGLGIGTLFAASAGAQSAPPAPQRMIDELATRLNLYTADPAQGYVVRLKTLVHGVTGRTDAARLDVKQGGRVLASARCGFARGEGTIADLECDTPESSRLTASGELTVELHYIDDQTDATELLRTFTLQVRRYPDWTQVEGDRITAWAYHHQVLLHDTVGTAFAFHQEDGAITFHVSVGGAASRLRGSDYSMRCSVNGTRTPDIVMDVGDYHTLSEVNERATRAGDTRTVQWTRQEFHGERYVLRWGRRQDYRGGNIQLMRFLGDHPGAWSCDLRVDGRVLRSLMFSVGADGRVAPHPEQTGPQAFRMVPGLTLIDVRLPSSPPDEYVDPAAIRASLQFGQPRRQADAWTASLATLPAASIGNANPTPVADSSARAGGASGGRRRGRR